MLLNKMALFNFSNDWGTTETGEDLCENFMKDGKSHKQKHRKKAKLRTNVTKSVISNHDKKSLIKNETVFNKSQTIQKRDNKSSYKMLKSKKHVLKQIKKKISNLHAQLSGRDDKVPLNSFTRNENSEVTPSSESRSERYKPKKSFKRKRTLSETTDESDSKPLLKKIKHHKKIKDTELVKDINSNISIMKSKKKKTKRVTQNGDTTQEVGAVMSSDRPTTIEKKMKKNIKDIKKKLKKKQLESPAGDFSSGKPLIENRIDPVQLKKRKKQLEKLQNLVLQKLETQSSLPVKKERPVLTLRQQMMQKLKAARFRFLNEQIYTTTSKETEKIFKSDPDAFKAYHEGYRQQVKKWPLNPLDRIIKSVNKMPKTHVIADFGCGEARLANSVEQKVHSFDLVAVNDIVTACDMAHVPLADSSIDVAVYCLSLMGTNLKDYLVEANRVLKNGGLLKIAEVESRFEDIKTFTKNCEQFGFKKTWMDLSHNLFYFIDFKKVSNVKGKKKLPVITLQPCMYKKR